MSSLSHAKHNRDACDHLLQSGKYNDWVITTAFYSALHFCEHSLFPLKITGNSRTERYEHFDNYCARNHSYSSRHSQRRELIEEYLSEDMAIFYNRLFDLCITARYSNYRFHQSVAYDARRYLKELEELVEE